MSVYGLIGSVLKHSYSKEIHKCFGLENYLLFELNESDFINKVTEKNYKGLNITVPYKQKVMKYLDVIDSNAKIIGAVNTIINQDGILFGYNTDYYGLVYLFHNHNISVKDKKIMVLGNGGVAQPVFHYLKTVGAKEVVVVKRKAEPGVITYNEALLLHNDVDIIINTSPVGMFPNVDESPMVLDGYSKLSAVIDLIANPIETKLMKYAKEKNIRAVGGLEMLVAQAKMAEELFFDIIIPDEEIDKVTKIISELMATEKNNLRI